MTSVNTSWTRSARGLTVLLTSVAYFMVTLDALVVLTALPSIHRDLGGGIGTLQWTVSAYNIAFGAAILTAAALGDRLGRRRVYLAGLALFTAASAACALAPDAGLLIAFRAVQGAGAATVLPLGLTLLTSAFPVERRGAVVGIWGGIAGLAVAAGPLVGGAITQALSWHWIFWVNVPIGAVAVLSGRLRLAESFGPRARLDVPALVLVSAGAGIAPVAGALSDKVGARALAVPGLIMQAAGFAWIVALAGGSSGYGSYVPPFVIAGVGISMALPCVTASGLNAVPPPMLGKAAGTLNTVQQFGAVFGIAVVTAVFNAEGSLASGAAVTSGFRPALGAAVGSSVLAAVIGSRLARRPRATVGPTAQAPLTLPLGQART